MNDSYDVFRAYVSHQADHWLATGLPSHQKLEQAAEQIDQMRERSQVNGLWPDPPLMLTATVDDGLGQGLAIIERFAGAIGIRLMALGLLQSPPTIIAACQRHQPDYLGLTVLQFDSEDDLAQIAEGLPRKTRIIAGGPVFTADFGFAERTGTHHTAKNVAAFLRFMLDDTHRHPKNSQSAPMRR
jgi:methylmalonyl-CoA mutase cobalamin-binding subunit